MSTQLESTIRALDAWNQRDLETYSQLYDSGVKIHGLIPMTVDLGNALGIYQAFFAGFPDLHLHVEDTVQEGDRLALRFRIHGTHSGEFQSIPATGREVNVGGMTIVHFQRGKVVERWNLLDQLSLMQQLGVIPAE